LLLLLALATYHSGDPSMNTAGAHGYASQLDRPVRRLLSDLLLQALGITAFLLPCGWAALGWTWMRSRPGGSPMLRWMGTLLALTFLPTIFGLLPWHWRWLHVVPIEGVVGRLMSGVLVVYLNIQGAWLVAACWPQPASTLPRLSASQPSAFQRGIPMTGAEDANAAPARGRSIWDRAVAEAAPTEHEAVQAPIPVVAASVVENGIAPQPAPAPYQSVRPLTADPRPASARFEPAAVRPAFEPAIEAPLSDEITIHERADAEPHTSTFAPKHVSGFKLPPSTLLNSGDGPQAVREDELREEARVLVEKCAEFDVRGQVVQINPGPMVTTYEFKPEAGVKYSRVTGLADDLCLAMRAESILIERMAGKNTVGIQVPNHRRETIHLRDCIESEDLQQGQIAADHRHGQGHQRPHRTADLAEMPHVLIAGSTGSGKSVAINAMIMSLLYRTTPAQVRLILVDPKRVELGMYEGVPHLFTPIITEPKLAANALRNAVREMERRYKLLASRSVRNIDQYNKLFEGFMPSLFADAEDEQPLPFIVIIIDELADLMMLDRANVEESITRLAQMSRAVGIHLILATQRPVGRCHHRPHQGQHPHPHQLPPGDQG
jgi:S-DNA-T family DNA segregation ATPase FtsK/SpoIIIE